jgi:hypothetical protein
MMMGNLNKKAHFLHEVRDMSKAYLKAHTEDVIGFLSRYRFFKQGHVARED